MSNYQDKDLSLKLRFRRILFIQGYWTPIEIELSQYENLGTTLKRRSLTDLDVLGIKYDILFTPSYVVGDCKSGKNVSDVNRLFWLMGVKKYFGADQAYLIHSNIESHARGIAPKLGLRVLDEEALSILENSISVKTLNLPIADTSIQVNLQKLWGINVPKGTKPTNQQLLLKEVYSYLSYSYWYLEKFRNLFNLLEYFKKIASILTENDPSNLLLAYSGLERFTHSLLETASYVSSQGATNIPRDVKNYLFGGVLALREKENFFRLLRNLTKSNEQLEPAYFQEVIELLGRIIRNPYGAVDILRFLEAVYLWKVYLNNQLPLSIGDDIPNTATVVLARDVANTFSKITGLRNAIFSAIDAY